jgi:hypothetical protein
LAVTAKEKPGLTPGFSFCHGPEIAGKSTLLTLYLYVDELPVYKSGK